MGISGISHRNPPVVSGGRVAADDEVIYQREMKFTRRDAFLDEIEDWMGRYMTKSRVSDLVNEASGLEEVIEFLKHAPTPMNPDGKRTIYAHLFWGRTARGDWWVRGLGFSTKASSESIETAKRRALRDRLEQKASARSEALPVPEWKVWFNPAEGSGDWINDANDGDKIVASLIEAAHARAKKLEPTLKNPIGTDFQDGGQAATEVIKAVAGALTGNLTDHARKGFEVAATAVDGGTKIYENAKDGSGFKAAGDVTDLALGWATGGNPISALGSTIIGMFIEIGIANDAGRVAKIRGRLYAFFVSGVLSKTVGLAPETNARPPEQEMLALGANLAASLKPRERYQLQLALLRYEATHNTANAWSFQTHIDKGWKFPTHYTQNWSRELLARSLAWQFGRLKYLIK